VKEQRRLAAILVADVVGYSKLVSKDEAGTLAKLQALRANIIEHAIAKHAGRRFKSVGDGFLVEFASAVQAVEAARAIQQANADGKLPLRIGIHVGDVVVQGDDLMGDGVNIAARIEGVAEAGGVAISRQVHDQIRDKLDLRFLDKGEVELKNIARPVHVFALGGSLDTGAEPVLALPDKSSIAVLPFQNMSGDPEQEYFVDGLVEDIITALSRTKALFVIARNSSFSYRGKSPDVRQVGRELGVRYVLEGSVRKAGSRVRITGQLIDAQNGTHLWAHRFDGGLEDVFQLQDDVTSSVVSAIGPTIERAEIDRSASRPTEILLAYDQYLRGLSSFYKLSKEASETALTHFQAAAGSDPNYARAFVMSAICHSVRRVMAWSVDLDREKVQAEEWTRRALQLDPRDPFVLARAACVLSYVVRNIEEASTLADRAIELDPNDAYAWTWSGWTRDWLGDQDEALRRFEYAIRLNPRDPQIGVTYNGMATAQFRLKRFAEAEKWARKALQELPDYQAALRALIASQALGGHVDQAKETLARYLRVDPKARVSTMRERFFPWLLAEAAEQHLDGFRIAGMPE
jgi:TolB-like protein/class 3 adenylate cyclase/tetratricopeptide (TPR) repeat protein